MTVARPSVPRRSLARFAWLSIVAALLTISLKGGAYALTGSVGLLSDALESVVNLVAAVVALIALTVAHQGPDEEHAYGHEKAEYFSSGIEGGLILLAAASIAYVSVGRLLHPAPPQSVALGLVISTFASLINLGAAWRLRHAARQYRSITPAEVQASAHRCLDLRRGCRRRRRGGAHRLALARCGHRAGGGDIVWAGLQLVRRSALGLLDTALPAAERATIGAVLARYAREQPVEFHALRTRESGTRRFVEIHVLVPGGWSVRRGHALLERLERDLRAALGPVTILTHLEPRNDPTSFADTALDRVEVG